MLVSDETLPAEAELFAAIVSLLQHKDALTCKTGCSRHDDHATRCWACRVQKTLETILDRATGHEGNAAHVLIGHDASWVELYMADRTVPAPTNEAATWDRTWRSWCVNHAGRHATISLTNPPQYKADRNYARN